ncbi:MAG: short-chain dehydrogenase [Gemmatimonadetes bacterium]|nr:short-chain dehydrogenase [Gemmatimonadota bacterium]
MSDTVIVITGASGGIGAAAAEELSRRGASVVLVARRPDALNEVVKRCGPRAYGIVADVTSRAAVRGVVAQAIERFGHVDVWINNVGQGITKPPSQLTDDDVDEIMRVNVKTALYGMQEILPHFKERNAGQVINVASMLARMPAVVIRAAYSASKHFLNALTANFRMEVQATHPGIQFSLVSPGVVRTDFGNNALHGGPDSRTFADSQSAEEVAVVIADLVESRRPDVYTRAGAHDRIVKYYEDIGADP